MNRTKELAAYFQNMGLFIIGLLLLLIPLFFLTITTDAFVMPKEIVLAAGLGLFFIFFVLKTISAGKLTFRSSPFDLPILLITLAAALSAVFSENRYDSLIGFTPLLFIVFFYFAITNTAKDKKQLTFLLSCLTLGAGVSGIFSTFSYFKIYLLPLEVTHFPYFTTFGSLLDQAIYLALILPIAGQFLYQKFVSYRFEGLQQTYFPKQKAGMVIFFALNFVVILVALGLSIYLLLTTQKPIILPLNAGLQISFASLSGDLTNVLKSSLLGSGIGTFLSDFTRFKAATYNTYANLWTFSFFRSSTYVLELIATTGILGLLTFVLLLYRIFREKTFFLPLLLAIIAAFVLPFSFTIIFIFFVILAIFAVTRIFSNSKEKSNEIDLYFVSSKRKLFSENQEAETTQKSHGKFLAIIASIVLLVIIGVPLYFATRLTISDIIFQSALVAASRNQGTQTYDLEVKAIQAFPYRDVYYRAFSQTNLALANILVQQQQGKQPDQQGQQKILTLIQQSINAGRSATNIGPATSFNWNNLSSVYRALIGFGQNADQFTLVTAKQAVALDPNNPQQYVEYGGIYYQLGNYDEAIRQFQFATTLKQDYANGYYNLGHALELKGNLQEAIQQYQIVKKLVANDKTNSDKIDADIAALQDKIGKQQAANTSTSTTTADEEQPPLDVNKSKTQLPERKPQVEIPGPSVSPVPTKATTKKPTPTP